MSTRGGFVPTILYWLTGFVPGEPATACAGVVALPAAEKPVIFVLKSLSPSSAP